MTSSLLCLSDTCFTVFMVSLVNVLFLVSSIQVAILIEMLPLSGVPLGSSVVGVSVLPAKLISTKPRLSVKSLVSDAKTSKK
jgi:hypothetical protein